MLTRPLRVTIFLLGAAFLLVAVRLIWVNRWQSGDLLAMAQNQRLTTTPAYEFARGDFLDRNGYPLTGQAERVLLAFPAQFSADQADSADLLTTLLNSLDITPTADIAAKISLGRPFVAARGLSAAQFTAIADKISGINGLFVTTYHPRYAANAPAAHIIGYVDKNGNGQSGLELQYDKILRNRPCSQLAIPCDEQGRQTSDSLRVIEAGTPSTAHNVRLTLDYTYQQILDTAMSGKNGAAVLLDVQNGDVLALTSAPGFDQTIGQPATTGDSYLNKATCYFPPASVFKLVLAAAALEEGIVDPNSPANQFTCTGAVTISTGQTVHCWQSSGHGTEDLSAAIANSCNPYFITLGQQLGGDLIREYAWRLGLTEQVLRGFNLNSQNMLDFNSKVPADVANVSIGEKGIRATPLMLARLLAAIANDGLLPEPRLVIDIEDDMSHTAQTVESATPRRVISSSTARTLRQMLVNAVECGTGSPVQSSLISIGGKTGTSQNFGVWFAGFFPAHAPRWALAVYIADGTSGGKSAGSLCREVAEKLALLEGIAATDSV